MRSLSSSGLSAPSARIAGPKTPRPLPAPPNLSPSSLNALPTLPCHSIQATVPKNSSKASPSTKRTTPRRKLKHANDAFDKSAAGKKDPSKCKSLLQFPDGTVFWSAKLAVDADGASAAPGRPNGKQLDPGSGDDKTTLTFTNGAFLSSEAHHYVVLPQGWTSNGKNNGKPFHADLGIDDVAIVIYKDKMTAAICGDLRPNRKIGEGSIRVHEDFYPPGPDPCKERHPKDKYCVCILRSLLISLLVLLSVVPLQAYRVVIIGDSHSDFLSGGEYGTFARHLKKILDDKGYETSLYAWSGSTPSMWLDGTNRSPQLGATVALDRERPEEPSSVPTLAKIFARQKSPVDLIVIELGTNLLDSKRLNTKIVNPHQINALADAVKPEAKVCLWVGAPNYPEKVFNKKQQETLWGAIRDNVTGKDRYVYDSRYQPNLSTNGNPEFLNHAEYCPITVVGKNHRTITDYEHLCTKAATAWAEGVSLFIDCIQKKSSSTPSTHQ